MDTRTSDGKKEVGTFLGLTFGLSAIFWALIISAGSLGVHASSGIPVSYPRYARRVVRSFCLRPDA